MADLSFLTSVKAGGKVDVSLYLQTYRTESKIFRHREDLAARTQLPAQGEGLLQRLLFGFYDVLPGSSEGHPGDKLAGGAEYKTGCRFPVPK